MTMDVVPNVAPAEGPAVPEPSAPNIVHVGEHTVTLHPTVTMALGGAARAIVGRTTLDAIKAGRVGAQAVDIEQAIIQGSLATVYLRLGIASWDFTDKDGNAEPVTPENIERLLPYEGGGMEVAEVADSLYSDKVFIPLGKRMSELSAITSMARSTSVPPTSGSKPPRPSKRSSQPGSAGRRSVVRA